MALEGRLRRLEQVLTGPDESGADAEPCPHCGGRLDVMFDDDPEPGPCGVCGHEPIQLRLTFDHPLGWLSNRRGHGADRV